MKTFTKENQDKIVSQYLDGVSKYRLSQDYHVSESVIKRILLEHGVQLRTIQQANKAKFKIDEKFFDIESSNLAYILGLWAADGNVSAKDNRLDLELNSLDYDLLEQIRNVIKSERPIKIYQCQSGYVKNKLYFWSAHVKQKMIEYGIVPNKMYSPDFHVPYKLSKKYWIDYIRGFFDGDGCIKKSSSITFELNSINHNFLKEIQQFFKEYYDIDTNISIAHALLNQPIMYRLYCYGESVKRIYTLLYTPNTLYMQRKYDKWHEYYNDIKLQETITASEEEEKVR